ncbi:MAG: copper-binding protein [Polyangiales bacterium]
MRRSALWALSATALLASAAVYAQPVASYTARGVVRSVAADGMSARIAHEAIPGFMGAMTMNFEASAAAQLRGVSPGDAVRFTFTHAGDGHLRLTSIARLPSGPAR